MSGGYEEDLAMYEEAGARKRRPLDTEALLRPISDLRYPENPAAVASGTSVRNVLDLMTSRKIGGILVVDDGKVTGIFTERDALMKGLHGGKGLDAPVGDYMTRDPDCLTPQDPIAFALNRMGVGGYRHMPLVNSARAPVGMLVMRDVVRYIVTFFPAEALNLPPHSENNPPERNPEGG